MFLVLADLDDVSKTEITSDEYPRFYYICYYERFRDYGLSLRIANKELQWAFGKILSTKGGFTKWEDWEITKIESLEEVDLSSERALKKQTKKMYQIFKAARKEKQR